MKIKYWALISATVFFLTGCTNTAKPVMENNTNTSSAMFMEEISSSPAEETLPSFTGEKLVYIDQRVFPNNKPCQSISIIEQGAGQPKLLIKVSEHEEFYFDPPALEYPKSINEIYFTDLNGDGVEEIIAVCMVGYYPGIYIIDIANHSYLVPPYTCNTAVGITYEVYSVDENHIQIKGGNFDSIVGLSYNEIWEWNANPDTSKENLLEPYREKGKKIGSDMEVISEPIEVINYNNQNCLKLTQRLRGLEYSVHLGYMETIISWDTNGETHIEHAEYIKQPIYLDKKIFENNNSCQSISIIKQGTGNPRLSIKVTEDETFYLDPPLPQYPHSFDEIFFTDLNGDNIDELVVICFLGECYQGIYIIDTANHSYLVPPYVNDMVFSVGVEYNIYSVDENHIQIKNKDFDAIIDLSYYEIWEWNGNPDISKKEEYFKPYREIGKQIGSASPIAYQSVETVTYNNHNCLKLIQRLCGPWGQFDHLGYMETIISWDTNGEFHIESITYLKRPPMGTDDPRI